MAKARPSIYQGMLGSGARPGPLQSRMDFVAFFDRRARVVESGHGPLLAEYFADVIAVSPAWLLRPALGMGEMVT